MSKLKSLFEFQRIEENEHLGRIISDVEKKYGTELEDSELEMAAGGELTPVERENEVQSFCEKCKTFTTFRLASGGRAVCKVCGTEKTL